MKGVQFSEANSALTAPEGREAEVYDLPVWTDGAQTVSKWKMTWWERFSVLFTGTVWFQCWGRTHPPMKIVTAYPFTNNA